jgi:hypothetical protein
MNLWFIALSGVKDPELVNLAWKMKGLGNVVSLRWKQYEWPLIFTIPIFVKMLRVF